MSEKAGTVALSSTPEELAKILAETFDQTARISKEFGLQL
jgi:tripartite-type tricarboxylate transporter receptor subunit TctC